MIRSRLPIVLVTVIATAGCGPQSGPEGAAPPVSFSDVSEQAGIRFKHCSGARGKKYMPETVGSGVSFIDFDNDGHLDIFFVNSTDWKNSPVRKPHYPALYHNQRNGTFKDITERSGLKHNYYGMGAAVGDFDNDGWDDIYLTCIGPNHLYRNLGDGRFEDVTGSAGVAGVPVEPGGMEYKWSTTAAFCDYDKDGLPDLFVCNYVHWTPSTDVLCTGRGGKKAYCAPTNYEGLSPTLYRGLGGGKFKDVSAATGVLGITGKSLGAVVADFNGDGWPDIAVTNDTSRNFLFMNDRGQRFREAGISAGFAFSDYGTAKAGMGIDYGDYLNNGKPGILTGNFAKEALSLFENDGNARFTDKAYARGIAEPSLLFLTFGLFFFDYDLDGRLDILTANGHIDDYVHESDAAITYHERPLLFHNEGERFTEVGLRSGPAMQKQLVGRGCAWGDYDRDGSPDIAFVSNNEAGFLWHNDTRRTSGWIGLKLRGEKSTRNGWGAIVTVRGGGRTQRFEVYGGGSFLSQRQIWPLVGLNGADSADSIDVAWPSGQTSHVDRLAAGRYYEIVEGISAAPNELRR